jgi:hypothetical protein
LWPKWLRPGGEVVVYSQPGEMLGGENFVLADGLHQTWAMPYIVAGLQIDAKETKYGFDLLHISDARPGRFALGSNQPR